MPQKWPKTFISCHFWPFFEWLGRRTPRVTSRSLSLFWRVVVRPPWCAPYFQWDRAVRSKVVSIIVAHIEAVAAAHRPCPESSGDCSLMMCSGEMHASNWEWMAHGPWHLLRQKKDLSGPVLRDTARLSQRYPPIACYGGFGVSTWPIGCDTPSPFSERFPLWEHAKWRCDTPPQKGYLSDTCVIPYENKAKGCAIPPSAILSRKGIARYGGVWAAKRKTNNLAELFVISSEIKSSLTRLFLSLSFFFEEIFRHSSWSRFNKGYLGPFKVIL